MLYWSLVTSYFIVKGLDRLRFVYKNCNFLASMGSKIKPITYTCQAQPRL